MQQINKAYFILAFLLIFKYRHYIEALSQYNDISPNLKQMFFYTPTPILKSLLLITITNNIISKHVWNIEDFYEPAHCILNTYILKAIRQWHTNQQCVVCSVHFTSTVCFCDI